ncbi:MAG: 3-dehydroquinate dehydratase-2 [Granulosicoccus sp.]|jgi:3-dehydroquinate dehydratase-2
MAEVILCRPYNAKMSRQFLIINGPNLNLLGKREPEVYGNQDLDSAMAEIKSQFEDLDIDHVQSNWEGGIIDALQDADGKYAGVVINAGGFTHTSVAIRDAISSINVPVTEVHISNLAQREDFRQTSIIAAACIGSINGFGIDSYRLGIEALLAAIK